MNITIPPDMTIVKAVILAITEMQPRTTQGQVSEMTIHILTNQDHMQQPINKITERKEMGMHLLVWNMKHIQLSVVARVAVEAEAGVLQLLRI